MKSKIKVLAGSFAAGVLSLSSPAQPAQSAPPAEPVQKLDTLEVTTAKAKVGAEVAFNPMIYVEVKNFQDESLGQIKDLGIDLINGQIVEVLITSDSSLDVGNKVVAVPPLALIADAANEVYRLNISAELFKSAAAIDLARWEDAGHSDRVATTYRLFGQDPYFLEEGATASTTASRPKVPLGYVERSSKILDLPVGNLKSEALGKVWTLTLDIPKGRIRSVVILAPGNFKTKSVVPAMALSFNAKRDALLLDDSKAEFADEPRYFYTAAANGQDAYSHEENYAGPRTSVPLVQGRSYRDIDRTVAINRNLQASKIDHRHVEVGTINGRVTLRGTVATAGDKQRIGAIAIAASRVELVDNQIVVAGSATSN